MPYERSWLGLIRVWSSSLPKHKDSLETRMYVSPEIGLSFAVAPGTIGTYAIGVVDCMRRCEITAPVIWTWHVCDWSCWLHAALRDNSTSHLNLTVVRLVIPFSHDGVIGSGHLTYLRTLWRGDAVRRRGVLTKTVLSSSWTWERSS